MLSFAAALYSDFAVHSAAQAVQHARSGNSANSRNQWATPGKLEALCLNAVGVFTAMELAGEHKVRMSADSA